MGCCQRTGQCRRVAARKKDRWFRAKSEPLFSLSRTVRDPSALAGIFVLEAFPAPDEMGKPHGMTRRGNICSWGTDVGQ